jgi:hypothetical protein
MLHKQIFIACERSKYCGSLGSGSVHLGTNDSLEKALSTVFGLHEVGACVTKNLASQLKNL